MSLDDTQFTREPDFRDLPGFKEFVGTMLEDAQLSEADEACTEEREERDCGTIYTLPQETYDTMRAKWILFTGVAGRLLAEAGDDYSMEQAGSDLWMTWAGHGVGFRDRDLGATGEQLDLAAVKVLGVYNPSPMLGDAGKVYLA
jgi:hypothetical protein